MGEMADDEIWRRIFGGMSKHPAARIQDHDATCGRCGATGLKWRTNDGGQWRLYEEERVEGNRKKLHETARMQSGFSRRFRGFVMGTPIVIYCPPGMPPGVQDRLEAAYPKAVITRHWRDGAVMWQDALARLTA